MNQKKYGNKGLRLVRRGAAAVLHTLFKALLCLLFAFPFYWMIITAFKSNAEIALNPPTLFPQVFDFSGFKAIFAVDLSKYIKNSLVVVFWTTVLQLLIMVPTAYVFAKYSFKGKGFFFSWIMVGFMVPGCITFVAVYRLFAMAGMLESYIPQIVPMICNGFGIFLLRQNFMQVPEELIESARLDEANEFQIVMKIMLPMAKSTLITIMLLSVMGTWNSYFWPLIMTLSDTYRPLPVFIESLKALEGGMQWPVIMAGNVVLVLPVLLAFLLASKKIIASLAYRGVK